METDTGAPRPTDTGSTTFTTLGSPCGATQGGPYGNTTYDWYALFVDGPEDFALVKSRRYIPGSLDIWGPRIRDLTFLSGVERICGVLRIHETALRDLSGLERLELTYGLNIGGNLDLVTLSGFGASEVGSLNILGNAALEDLRGLEKLRELDALGVRFNDSLKSTSGLSSLEVVWSNFTIDGNPSLTTLGLDALEGAPDSPFLVIQGNPLLCTEELDRFRSEFPWCTCVEGEACL